jgi:integrase/recombinase XerD
MELPVVARGEVNEDVCTFLDSMALERSLSPRTVDAYGRDLEEASGWFLAIGKALASANREDLASYGEHLAGKGLAVRSVRRKLSSLRAFFRFLARDGQRADDPSAFLRPPRGRPALPETLTVEQAVALVEAWSGDDRISLRNRALMELAYGCGLRESELIDLTADRVNLEEGYVRPVGKGGKERIVPLGGPARRALTAYVELGRPRLVGRKSFRNLFLSYRGRPLSRMSVWQIVSESADRAGLSGRIHPHLLRHSFATHLLEGGADLRVVQELLGHADIRTTEIYTNIDRTHLSEVVRTCHPRSRPRG